MKQEKVFVRYNNFDEGPPPGRGRNERKPYEKKKYAEKPSKVRQGFKHISDSFELIKGLPKSAEELLQKYPKFFTRQSKPLQKESTQLLNDYLILHPRKFFEGLKEPRKDAQNMLSSSDPDWNSDDDVDSDLKSDVIEQSIVDKVSEAISGKPISRPTKLKPHEKKFLEDHYRQKRQQNQDENNQVENRVQQTQQSKSKSVESALPSAPPIKTQAGLSLSLTQESNGSNVNWSDYQERQLNTFVNMGFMTKIEENEEDMQCEVIEDDDMFNEDSNKSESSSSKHSSSSGDEDDIFGDQTPTTTIKTKQEEPVQVKVQNEKKMTQGTVVIKDHIFSDIAESIGLMPTRCNWIIRNEYNTKYKVSTDYMDAYYRKEKMYEMLPLISLNHSEFVRNQNVETFEGLATLKDFNSRKVTNYSHKPKYNYKQYSHHHKKK